MFDMALKEEFINAGFSVVETEEKNNRLLDFIKDNCPQVIRDNEVKIGELKTVLGLPVDEKVNGYGLNFVGRNVARAKYALKTAKELKINETFSKDFDTTQNMVLKGDNIDCLKILKSYYNGRIKCIYIDPPYNTDSDEFVYPDKFDREEAEILGLVNLSETDMTRLEFSFKTKKSHNGWLSFMYPRLLLARDLLTKDGVIFISIDDNEQANLKLLCDEIFGEENFEANVIPIVNPGGRDYKQVAMTHEYLLIYSKSEMSEINEISKDTNFEYEDSKGGFNFRELRNRNPKFHSGNRPNLFYPFYINPHLKNKDGYCAISLSRTESYCIEVKPYNSESKESVWRWGREKAQKNLVLDDLDKSQIMAKQKKDGNWNVYEKNRKDTTKVKSLWNDTEMRTENGTREIRDLFGTTPFDHPKPIGLLKRCLQMGSDEDSTILDFFAGSGTTAHAVMQLNADGEGNGNRHFILCQIDELIKEDKPAHKFCVENNLPSVISSITIERLRRAGEKIKEQQGLINNVDIGFKVFDTVDAPKLEVEENGQIVFPNINNDPLSRIYNMIFSVGIDDPTAPLECVLEKCTYKIDSNYYITNAAELDKKANIHILPSVVKKGRIFIDGWTASINTTLQSYKDDVKIVI
jgi:adenine-specific DNA-methyltransferase